MTASLRKPIHLQPTDIPWIALGSYVIGCNLVLSEQLSVAVDRYLSTRRRTTEVVLLALYLHLSNRVNSVLRGGPGAEMAELTLQVHCRVDPESLRPPSKCESRRWRLDRCPVNSVRPTWMGINRRMQRAHG